MQKNIDSFISEMMVVIPEGIEVIRHFRDEKKWISSNYKMGIPSKGDHQKQSIEHVTVESFLMLKYTVTNHLFHEITGSVSEDMSQALHPKVDISWLEAINFCNKMSMYFDLENYYSINKDISQVSINEHSDGFRLPTDAEWQFACKADSDNYQYSDIDCIAWHVKNSKEQAHEVGLKAPNSWGLYDMLGNVWEWCWDLYNPETYDDYRIFRGGSYAEERRICGATTRRKSMPDFKIEDLGFRVVKNIKRISP